MSTTGNGGRGDSGVTLGPGGFPVSAEQVYFRRVEETFLALRGSPLTLTQRDDETARGWYAAGIPVDFVERVLREVFARRRERGTTDKMWTLRQCDRAVVAAWEGEAKRTAPARTASDAPVLDVAASVAALAARVPEGLPGAGVLRERIAGLQGDPERVEEELAHLDAELVAAAEATLDPAARAEFDTELARALERLAKRLPRDEVAAAEERLRRQLLRRRLELPELSLFA